MGKSAHFHFTNSCKITALSKQSIRPVSESRHTLFGSTTYWLDGTEQVTYSLKASFHLQTLGSRVVQGMGLSELRESITARRTVYSQRTQASSWLHNPTTCSVPELREDRPHYLLTDSAANMLTWWWRSERKCGNTSFTGKSFPITLRTAHFE